MGEYPTLRFQCPVRWEAMQGNDRRRFCEHCQKHLTHLSALSRAERKAFLEEPRTESPCVSYRVGQAFPAKAILGALAAGLALLTGCAKSSDTPPGGEASRASRADESKRRPYAETLLGRVGSPRETAAQQTRVGGMLAVPTIAPVPEARPTGPLSNPEPRIVVPPLPKPALGDLPLGPPPHPLHRNPTSLTPEQVRSALEGFPP